ncbi:MAG: sigma-70 family RNA polymerase sigma factor [Gammaproteobacteria bacterium]|nr:sigma-70 family RNA polymerase sigma factor [Gammaproteobacteria bacterium]
MWNKQAKFTALVNALSTDLYRYAYWLCRDKDLAQDLVQETFTRAWRAIDSLREETAAKQWLITTLRREYARQFERLQPEFENIEVNDLVSQQTENDTSIEALLLRQALGKLSIKYREPLLLQVIWGYNCDEIAELLDITRSTVMTRLFRARHKLREMLTGHKQYEQIEFGAKCHELP